MLQDTGASQKQVAVLNCQLRKTELSRKSYEVTTEKLLQFAQVRIIFILVDLLLEVHMCVPILTLHHGSVICRLTCCLIFQLVHDSLSERDVISPT